MPPLTTEQMTWIVLQYGKLGSIAKIRRSFRVFFKTGRHDSPSDTQIRRVIGRFKKQGTVGVGKSTGRPRKSNEKIPVIDNAVKEIPSSSISSLASTTDTSKTTTWRILRKDLGMFPYKPKLVQALTPAHKESRDVFCTWLLSHNEDFPQKIIWTDEKLWHLNIHPNRQNVRYWSVNDPEIEVECKQMGGPKIMCWAGLIDGKIMLHWFNVNENVNQTVYLDMLQKILWPKVRNVSSRKAYWFQQDGATAHTALTVREWLESKFDHRIISRFAPVPWPARSPDLSPLDYWLWSFLSETLHKNHSHLTSIEELKSAVENIVSSISSETVRKAVQNVRRRAVICHQQEGAAFQYKV